jgi:hypothetical protein
MVKSRVGSKFNNKVPVIMLELTIPQRVPAEVVDELLSEPEQRLEWDKDNVLAYECLNTDEDSNISTFYIMNKFPWPMQNREFMELRHRRFLDKEIR